MNLGEHIHKLRKKGNLSQEQLAEKVGVTRQTISKWELGETTPDIKQVQTLSQVFDVSIEGLLGDDPKEVINDTTDYEKRKIVSWKKVIAVSVTVLCLCLVAVGVFSFIERSQILYPQGTNGNAVITRKNPIQIDGNGTDSIVFSENGKPAIACRLPEGFTANAETPGLYADKLGNFIKFNADYASKVLNPLTGTEYYSYYEERGYNSYIEMARAAMYYDLPKLGVFASEGDIYLAGGAQLIRWQLCAGQSADYYEIDGGLTESGEETLICGFALHFENAIWFITLKDYEDNYYFITIKDPNGVGKTIDTVGELLDSVYAGNAIQHSNVKDSKAIQEARNAYQLYITEHSANGGILGCCVFQADSTRFVAFQNGTMVGLYYSLENALKAMLDNPDSDKLFATDVDNLWVYGAKHQ